MALRTPPSWLQNGSHPAENDRLTQQAIFSSTGIIGASSMQVTAQGSPNMTVNVAAGWASILSSTSNAGVYVAYNDAAVTLTVPSNPTYSPRIDRVVATVSDSYYSGATNTVAFQYLTGTTSAPAIPNNSISLATISVALNATSVTSGNITDTRSLASSTLVSQSTTFLPIAGGTMTGTEILAAGTTSVAPLKFQNGVALSAAAGAAVEYDGANAYLTPSSAATSGRGALGAGHYYEIIGTTPTIASSANTYLSLLGVGLTVAASTTYEVELNLTVSGLGSTPRTVNFNLLGNGTATLQTNGGGYLAVTNSSAAMAANNSVYFTTPGSDLQIASGSTATLYNIYIRGLIRVNASGTINPAIKFSVATGTAGVTVAGSYARFTPVTGTSSFLTNSNLALGAWA